jgi:hypothetical protein
VKLIIFHSWLCEVGGCETVLYNMCEQLKDWYEITVIYTDGYYKQIQRLNKLVNTIKYDPKETYECDLMIRNSSWGEEPNNIKANKNIYVQMIHADYKVLKENGKFIYKKWDKTTHHVGCGEHVAKTFTEVTGYKCTPIKNILGKTLPIEKIYKYIYAGRLSDDDKKSNLWRIKQFLKMHEDNNIKYNLFIYTTSKTKEFADNENVLIRKARYYDLHNEMADADYGILFSDAEGLPCFVQECLQYGTPCIVTNNGGCMELIKDGVNGYVVPMDMNFDINKIKNIPKVENYSNGTTAKTWCDFLGYAEYKKKKERKDMKYLVKFNEKYRDTFFDDSQELDKEGNMIRRDKYSEPWIVNEERKEYLLLHNAIEVIEIIEDKTEENKEDNYKKGDILEKMAKQEKEMLEKGSGVSEPMTNKKKSKKEKGK